MGLISIQLVWLGLGAIVVSFHNIRLAITVWRNLQCAENAPETWQEDCYRQALAVLPAVILAEVVLVAILALLAWLPGLAGGDR
jgi:hypothetical protein